MGEYYWKKDANSKVTVETDVVRDLSVYGYNMSYTTVTDPSADAPYHVSIRLWIPGHLDISRVARVDAHPDLDKIYWEVLMESLVDMKSDQLRNDLILFLSRRIREDDIPEGDL